MIIEAGSYSLEQCFVQFKLTAHGYSPLRYRSVLVVKFRNADGIRPDCFDRLIVYQSV